MADEPLKFEYRISRETGFLFAGASLLLTFAAIGTALSGRLGFSRWEWVSQSTIVALYGVGAVVVARWSLRGFFADHLKRQYVELTEDCIKVPRPLSLGRITESVVPLDRVTKMLCSRGRHAGRLTLWHAKTRTAIAQEFLRKQDEFDVLRISLTERLEGRGVPVKTQEFRLDWPQFSLRFLFLVTTIVAAVLGVMVYAGVSFTLNKFLIVMSVAAVYACAFTAFFFGRWWLKALVVGFVLGFLCEFFALSRFLESTSSGWALPGGGPLVYPITSLLWQDVLPYHMGQLGTRHMVLAIMAGPTLSGVLLALMTLAVGAGVRRFARRYRA